MKHLILSVIFLFIILTNYSQSTDSPKEKWTCYTDDKILLMDDDHGILGVFEYVDGSLWVITRRGINIFDGKQWKRIDHKTDLMRKYIASYLFDSKNRIWIGTSGPEFAYGPSISHHGGVSVFNGKKWETIRTKEMGIKAPIVTRMFETSSGDIWLGVSSVNPGVEKKAIFAKGGLLRFSNNEWTVYRGKDILCIDCVFVKGFYEDTNGRAYFWADNGLYYFENDSFHVVRKKQGYNIRDRQISAVFKDSKNNLWLGAPARIAMYNGKQWKTFNRKNGLPERSWRPLGFNETKDNRIIISMTNGLYTYDGSDQWEREKKKFMSSNAYVDKENRVWTPTHKGLEIKERGEWSIQKDFPHVLDIFSGNDGSVWALSRAKGVKRFKDGNWMHYTDKNQLPSNKIKMGYVTKDGTVWIGTKKGICKCEHK